LDGSQSQPIAIQDTKMLFDQWDFAGRSSIMITPDSSRKPEALLQFNISKACDTSGNVKLSVLYCAHLQSIRDQQEVTE
jgi:hypothetical protein